MFGVKGPEIARSPQGDGKRLTQSQSWNDDVLDAIADITGIPEKYIESVYEAKRACFAKKLSWASLRVTSRAEDMAYCLLGLLNINMPLLYGEGGYKAFRRLQQEFIRQSDDESIFAWFDNPFSARHGILASRPDYFRHSNNIEIIRSVHTDYTPRQPYAVTNKGLLLESLAYKLWGRASKEFRAMQLRQLAEIKGDSDMDRGI